MGATVALCGLFAGPISGASMNPARSLGPALLGDAMDEYWIYLIGPFVGSTLAAAFTWVLHCQREPAEVEAAAGEEEEQK